MTAPIVIRQKGVGEVVQQAAVPFLNALQDRRAQEIQKAQFSQRQALLDRQLKQQQESQQRSQAATFLMAAINQGVPATDPIIAQFEKTLEAPGLAKAFVGATERSKAKESREFEEFLEKSGFSNVAKRGLRVDRALAGMATPPTAEIRTQMFLMVAPGEESALEKARLEEIRARTRKLNRELEATEAPTEAQQRRAAAAQGIVGDNFLPFIDYAEILTTRLKQKESDPGALVIRTALNLIAQTTDILGQPTSLPQEAVSVAIGVIRDIVPGAEDIQISPESQAVLAVQE
ncbi:hypothetical protein LCGC14_2776400, partial [marine sediment metagenome]